MDIATVVTSAAVGAVAAAIVNLIGQWLERRSRSRELLLAKAVELAIERSRFAFEVAKASGQSATLRDHAELAATYFRWLNHILAKGILPEDAGRPVGADQEAI